MQLAVATLETDLEAALELGGRALSLAESSQRAVLVGVALETQALVLGGLQHAGSLAERSPARFDTPLRRRLTSGTEAQLEGKVLYHALALPRVDALFPDASARTLLNRNLRLLLRGYAAAGVPLRYFGTEVLTLLGRPVALVGYDQLASGAVLIELLIGLESACVVRSALKREPPAALYAVLGAEPAPLDLLMRASQGALERLGAEHIALSGELAAAPLLPARAPAEAPQGAAPIPLGLVEARVTPAVQLGGDLLVSRVALAGVEAAASQALAAGDALSPDVLVPLQGLPLDGARPADLLTALQTALTTQ